MGGLTYSNLCVFLSNQVQMRTNSYNEGLVISSQSFLSVAQTMALVDFHYKHLAHGRSTEKDCATHQHLA
ncbi:uncharacterized protein PHALS_15127 [Plasmopara halstedii]|uniref:Uncharacterized protein n=1 Tax=Plasmopara halstedii TaxID=4781 RepID=A0A0P1ABV3_PLAHL|nr:uncharacterized protein PHALS_15127 [Plasmopara halstedii]CEG37890.1 hypothetical protein PHALS_15127 [Plasmopara halstedii]|eukprot:XP_024574259.1 hypothetical protein PHALS_15127 [Plasmopara halstedii]